MNEAHQHPENVDRGRRCRKQRSFLKESCRDKGPIRRETKENKDGVIGRRRRANKERENKGILPKDKNTSESEGRCVITTHRWPKLKKGRKEYRPTYKREQCMSMSIFFVPVCI